MCDTDISEMVQKFQPLENNVKILQNEMCKLWSEIKFLKKASTSNNLIIFNIPDNDEVNVNLCGSILNTFQSVNIDIRAETIMSVSRLGKVAGNRPVKICFNSREAKSSLFRFTSELRNLKLSISDDLTPEERATRKSLISFFPALRKRGFNPKVRDDKIMIDKRQYSADEVKAMLNIPVHDLATGMETSVETFSNLDRQSPNQGKACQNSPIHAENNVSSPRWPSLPKSLPLS